MKTKEFNELVTPHVNGKYGAPMGRVNRTITDPNEEIPKTTTRRVYISSDGYDVGGAYWGLGDPLYVTYSKCGRIMTYFRSKTKPQ